MNVRNSSGKTSCSPTKNDDSGAARLLVRARGQLAEVHVRQEVDLVVVVEDDAAVPREAEVLREEVAREDVRLREVADRLAEVEDRGARAAPAERP